MAALVALATAHRMRFSTPQYSAMQSAIQQPSMGPYLAGTFLSRNLHAFTTGVSQLGFIAVTAVRQHQLGSHTAEADIQAGGCPLLGGTADLPFDTVMRAVGDTCEDRFVGWAVNFAVDERGIAFMHQKNLGVGLSSTDSDDTVRRFYVPSGQVRLAGRRHEGGAVLWAGAVWHERVAGWQLGLCAPGCRSHDARPALPLPLPLAPQALIQQDMLRGVYLAFRNMLAAGLPPNTLLSYLYVNIKGCESSPELDGAPIRSVASRMLIQCPQLLARSIQMGSFEAMSPDCVADAVQLRAAVSARLAA